VLTCILFIQSNDHSSVIQELEAKKKELLDRCATLESKNQSLIVQNQNLKREHQIELEKVTSKVEDSEKRAKTLRIQVGRLQAYLTKNATNANELIDSEVKAKLEMIQAKTQTLVGKFCVGDCKNPSREPGDFATFDDDWTRKLNSLKNKSRLSHEDQDVFRKYWVRSKVYMLLEKRIFSQQVFGLEPDLENPLAEFERLVVKHNRGKRPPLETSPTRSLKRAHRC
jgi:chromosome segregation ATPase